MSRSNPWKSKPRFVRHTTLIVVEGDTEKAFVKHLNKLFGRYCGTRISIEPAYGGSGDAILQHAIKLCPGFDAKAVLYDGDRPPTVRKLLKESTSRRIQHLISFPAIEGVLLAILGKQVPSDTKACKRAIALLIPESLTQPLTYERHFPAGLLLQMAPHVEVLSQLLSLLNVKS
jgi:hypothetical protein